MAQVKLFMLLLGSRVEGRYTEQHDIFFGIGENLGGLVAGIVQSWPAAKEKIHIDAWREVTCVDGYSISVHERQGIQKATGGEGEKTLFFINLGGYKANEFEEFHYKMLTVDSSMEEAKTKAKRSTFHKHTTLADSAIHHNATSHIDDKYGIDVDDIYNIQDILPLPLKEKYEIRIALDKEGKEDSYHLGYLKLDEIA